MAVEVQQKATVPPCVSLASMWIWSILHAPNAHQVTFRRTKMKARVGCARKALIKGLMHRPTARNAKRVQSRTPAVCREEPTAACVRQVYSRRSPLMPVLHARQASIRGQGGRRTARNARRVLSLTPVWSLVQRTVCFVKREGTRRIQALPSVYYVLPVRLVPAPIAKAQTKGTVLLVSPASTSARQILRDV